jgi:hypothetical protein
MKDQFVGSIFHHDILIHRNIESVNNFFTFAAQLPREIPSEKSSSEPEITKMRIKGSTGLENTIG